VRAIRYLRPCLTLGALLLTGCGASQGFQRDGLALPQPIAPTPRTAIDGALPGSPANAVVDTDRRAGVPDSVMIPDQQGFER
jgi:hypothetical protein